MNSDSAPIVIGLTGAFGSGCTSAARQLRDQRGFEVLALSDGIKNEWKTRHGAGKPPRADLQKIGDELREKNGGGALVDIALNELAKKYDGKPAPARIVIDGIRNTNEIKRLQNIYGYGFVLVGILSSPDDRWSRIGSEAYVEQGLGRADFIADDQRDKDEEIVFGQQVDLCIDKADILIDNSTNVTLPAYQEKILAYIDLASGQSLRPASQREILMNIAFSASHSSKCVKRHVGAVVVDIGGQVVGVGYNENPIGTHPCIEEPTYDFQCFRDIVRNNHFKSLNSRKVVCPVCAQPIPEISGPPWKCPNCEKKGEKNNLERFFFPDRALTWCTAIHAEVWAILAAGERCRKGTILTTAFPCFQCAEKIIQVGLGEVIYTESYPDAYSRRRLELAGITLHQFEGVRSASFERIFSRNKPV